MIEQQPSPAGRKTFFDQFFQDAQTFGHDVLAQIPELEGVAIVPTWSIAQDRLPHGIVMGRRGALRTPSELMHMAQQLHAVLHTHLDKMVQDCLVGIDDAMAATAKRYADRMKQLEEEVHVKQLALDRLNAALAAHAEQRPTSPYSDLDGSPGK